MRYFDNSFYRMKKSKKGDLVLTWMLQCIEALGSKLTKEQRLYWKRREYFVQKEYIKL